MLPNDYPKFEQSLAQSITSTYGPLALQSIWFDAKGD
jgi:hypothetical protein